MVSTVPTDWRQRLRDGEAQSPVAPTAAAGAPPTQPHPRPVAETLQSLQALHAEYTALLAANSAASWAPSAGANQLGAGEGETSVIALLASDASPTAAAVGAVQHRLEGIRADLRARRVRQAIVQRYTDLQSSVVAKRRMVAALTQEIAVAENALAVADESAATPSAT